MTTSTTDWNRAARRWREQRALIAVLTRPATDCLLRELRPRPGEQLLDLASGTGDPALELARAVAPTGRVIAVDGATGMLAGLCAHRTGRGPHAVAAAAEALPLCPGRFDGLSCRFGAMFLDPPARGLGEMHRALRPGGRAVFVVWGARDANPWFTTSTEALDEAGAPAFEPPPGAPTVFTFAEPGRLAALLAAAGFGAIAERRHPFTMRVPRTAPEHLLDVQCRVSDRIADRVKEAGPERTARARAAVASRVARWARDGDLCLPAECVVLAARA